MNTLNIILQAAQNPQGGSQLSFWLMIILIFVVMYFFMIRPQRKQQKEMEKFRSELKKGDKVIAVGGIYGTVAEIDDHTVLLKIDGETKIRVDKMAIQRDPYDAQPRNTAGNTAESK